MTTPPESMNILIVEDDEVDVEVLRRMFRKNGINNTLYHALSGVEALEILRGENGREKIPPPCVMLIDINMPRMNGLDFLREVRSDAALKKSVAFILTTSARDTDIAAAYDLNAAGYFLKDAMQQIANLFQAYRQINKFPEEGIRAF